MYVFGGWVPVAQDGDAPEREWKCTNTLACLDMKRLQWESLATDIYEGEFVRKLVIKSAF